MKISLLISSFALALGCVALSASAEDEGASSCRLDTLHGTMAWCTTLSTATHCDRDYDSETVPWVYFVSAGGEHYHWNNNQRTGVINSGRADRVSRGLLVN